MNEQRLLALRQQGYSPAAAVDGGAHRGDWSRMFKRVFPEARVLAVEANPECAAELRRVDLPGFEFDVCLLGDSDAKVVDFYMATGGDATGNSMFRENTEHFADDNMRVERLPTRTLDAVCEARGMHAVDFIKLDVQGAELVALDGAPRALSTAVFVLLEVSVMQYNQGAPLFEQVTAYMQRAGFRLFDIFDLHYYHGRLNQVDVLFARRQD